MKDVQKQEDIRNIDIDKVGIKNLLYPVKVLDKSGDYQSTTAKINMYVNLPHQLKGTHMSRFVEMLHIFHSGLSFQSFRTILNNIKKELNAVASYIEITFPYFIKKKSPVSKSVGFMNYECTVIGKSNKDDSLDLILKVSVPINSVCPCSKEISDNGAHNQRGRANVAVRSKKFMWIEDIVKIVESSASSDLYPILKRVDEKFVTEKAFANPKFVEDISRDIALKLKKDSNIIWFEINVENYESIHNHNAYAYIVSNS